MTSKDNSTKKPKIAWFTPNFLEGMGGHRTIFQNINHLSQNGYECDIYFNIKNENTQEILRRLKKGYGDFYGCVHKNSQYKGQFYDLAIATSWDTAKSVRDCQAKKKVYFIQDFEPWFYPAGYQSISASETYNYGFSGISIGKWLANKLDCDYFNFCADLTQYFIDKQIKKEKAICYVFQPDKPRRCSEIALRALHIVQKLHPEVKIYLYGSAPREIKGVNVKQLGIISVEDCNKLYNKCLVGLCMSASNPSRVPFEMMAAGLPVVELYQENNLYDLPPKGCLLAESSPESVATSLITLIENQELSQKLSQGGSKFMEDYPLTKGYDQFLTTITRILNSGKRPKIPITKSYNKAPILASQEALQTSQKLPNYEYFKSDTTIILEQQNQRILECERIINQQNADIAAIKNSRLYKTITTLAKPFYKG